MPKILSPTLQICPHGSTPSDSQHSPFKRQKIDGSAASGFISTPRSWSQNVQPYGDEHMLHDKANPCQSTSASGPSFAKNHLLLSETSAHTQIQVATDESAGRIPLLVAWSSSRFPIFETHSHGSTLKQSDVLHQPPALEFAGLEPVKATSEIGNTVETKVNAQTTENGKGITALNQSNILCPGRQAHMALYQPPSLNSQTLERTGTVIARHMTPQGAAVSLSSEQPLLETMASIPQCLELKTTQRQVFRNPLSDLHQIVSESDKSMSMESNISDVPSQSTPLGDLGKLSFIEVSSQQCRTPSVEDPGSAFPAIQKDAKSNDTAEQQLSNQKVQGLTNNTALIQTPDMTKEVYQEIVQTFVSQPSTDLGKVNTRVSRQIPQSCSPSLPNRNTRSIKSSPVEAARACNEDSGTSSTLPSTTLMSKDDVVIFPLCTSCGIKRVFGKAGNRKTEVLW